MSWTGKHYQIPELMIEPHPDAPVKIMCGGESEAALRRAARGCATAASATPTPGRTRLRRSEHSPQCDARHGRENDSFEIMLALREPASVDLFNGAEDIGVTAVMCSPWAMADDVSSGAHDVFKLTADRYRAPIERFAEDVLAKMS